MLEAGWKPLVAVGPTLALMIIVLAAEAAVWTLLVRPLPPVEAGAALLNSPCEAELLAGDAGPPTWLVDRPELPTGLLSAWAIPDALASAAPTPKVSAPTPNQVLTGV
jgi:hypothetical protein